MRCIITSTAEKVYKERVVNLEVVTVKVSVSEVNLNPKYSCIIHLLKILCMCQSAIYPIGYRAS
jgi:hypothetical protein